MGKISAQRRVEPASQGVKQLRSRRRNPEVHKNDQQEAERNEKNLCAHARGGDGPLSGGLRRQPLDLRHVLCEGSGVSTVLGVITVIGPIAGRGDP